jgi:ribosomal protein L37AE/L43A
MTPILGSLNRTPRCATCKAILTEARLVIGGLWTCADCAYEMEYGEAARRPRERARRVPPQMETLFSLSSSSGDAGRTQ